MSTQKTVVVPVNENTPATEKKINKNLAAKMGIGAAGVAGGAAIMELLMGMRTDTGSHAANDAHDHYQKPDVHAAFHECKEVSDDMSFSEAFKLARYTEGTNGFFHWHGKVYDTLYNEESDKLTPDERKHLDLTVDRLYDEGHKHDMAHAHAHDALPHHAHHPVVIVYDQAPHATPADADMSFRDAFTAARAEVGPGGVFEWHGQTYNTYTSEEYAYMSADQKHDFVASLGEDVHVTDHDISAQSIDITEVDHDPAVAVAGEETFVRDEWVDDDHGGKIHIGLFTMDGHNIVKIDNDGDGVYELTVTKEDDGKFHIHDNVNGDDYTMTEQELQQLQHESGNTDTFGEHDVHAVHETNLPNDHHIEPGHIDHQDSDFDPNVDLHI